MIMNRCIVNPIIGGVNLPLPMMLPPWAPIEYSCQQQMNMPELSSQASVLSSHHTMASIPGFISHIAPIFFGMFSYLVSAITNLALPMATQIQNLGETLLTACVLLSVIQASIALYQYRYDVRGQLVFPLGVEDCCEIKEDTTDGETELYSNNDNEDTNNDEIGDILSEIRDEPSNTMPQLLKKMNKALVLLLPWIVRNIHMLLTRNAHLFHIGFIITLARFLEDIMQDEKGDEDEYNSPTFFQKVNDRRRISKKDKDPLRVLLIGDSLAIGIGCVERFDAHKDNSVPMMLVEKTQIAGQYPHANKKLQGPVFPAAFARSLSHHYKQPVHWRSAGVDGGDINDINRFCIDVLNDEVASEGCFANGSSGYVSGPPDIVVVIFGINDLKHLLASSLSHPFSGSKKKEGSGGGIIHKFRHSMDALLNEIHARAPNAIVVFPAMPVQSYHKNSVVNIFPLGMVWDAVLGFFLRQKKNLANKRENCIYLDLTAQEIANWYKTNNEEEEGSYFFGNNFDSVRSSALLSSDGVHPNKRMYALWAETVGRKFCDCVAPLLAVADDESVKTE
jgi:lysophospholipase L1-like esterase